MFKEALQEGLFEAINSLRNWTGTISLYSAMCNELLPGIIHCSCDSFCQTLHWTREFILLGESQLIELRLEHIK